MHFSDEGHLKAAFVNKAHLLPLATENLGYRRTVFIKQIDRKKSYLQVNTAKKLQL